MAQQLDAIVDASRLESGLRLELRRESTDLVDLAKKAVAERQATLDRHVLRVTIGEPQVIGEWDPLRLGRVLDNLLDNAIKFSPRGGAIEVTVTRDAGDAMLTVADRGEGIPAADLPHIFEQFRRGRNVEGRIPGTGIGLHGARQLIEMHGGSVTADSEIGVGTRITVRLPCAS
jgi:signal transduction histidine kinase